MSVFAYALLLFDALAGGFVSGLAGFGTALMALGIWLYVLPPSIVVPLVLICSIVAQPRKSSGWRCSRCRRRYSARGSARGPITR
jgi:uncharacterized membrane protein YfcA